MRDFIVIAHNLRSSHNVGSLLRTADGLGVTLYLTGYTPYPISEKDVRLPHIAKKINEQIRKTALGAERSALWGRYDEIEPVISRLKKEGFIIAALEQTDNSVPLPNFELADKLAIIIGREVEGIEPEILEKVDLCLEIPMFGKKESYNVVQAAAMAMYHFRFNLKQQ